MNVIKQEVLGQVLLGRGNKGRPKHPQQKSVICVAGGEAERLILAGVERNPGVNLLVLVKKI